MKAFAQLDFEGADAATFLQGYVTANLDDLRPDRALPMAFCNVKGRVIANGWAVGEPCCVRLLVHDSVADTLASQLGKYLLFAKAKLKRSQGGLRFSTAASTGAVLLPPTGWFASFDASDDAHHALFAAACADLGFVVVEQNTSQAFLPQMIGLTAADAVSFAKGCYLGQEVIARAEHRGAVKQKLRRYRCQDDPPAVGADVWDQERKVGTVVAVGSHVVLAVTRTDQVPLRAGEGELIGAATGDRGAAFGLHMR